jgi:hypothetical protein
MDATDQGRYSQIWTQEKEKGVSFRSKRAEETKLAVVSFAEFLGTDELLTGTPTAEEVSTAHLTIDEVAINDTATVMMWSRSVAISNAVTFLVSDGQDGREYDIDVTVSTDAGQTLVKRFTFRVN